MRTIPGALVCLLIVSGLSLPACNSNQVEYDATIPQIAFVEQEIAFALKEVRRENLQVSIRIKPDESSPESFQIRTRGAKRVEITASDVSGAMYGGLEGDDAQ